MSSHNRRKGLIAGRSLLLFGLTPPAWAQTPSSGRLDFLKAQNSSFALLANTSAHTAAGKTISQRSVADHRSSVRARNFRAGRSWASAIRTAPAGEPCGRLRNIAISPDGDTALVTTDPATRRHPLPATYPP